MLVKYTRTNIYGIGKVTLKPGINEVSPKAVKDFNDRHKTTWKRLLAEGVIEKVESKSAVTVKMVKETSDLSLLKEWETDSALKGPVKGAVRKQIAEIESVVDEIKAKQEEVL